MAENKYFVMDFDSTIVQVEPLDELAAVYLKKRRDHDKLLNQIKEITRAGMEGKIPFSESLEKRVGLLKADRASVKEVTKRLKKKITPSILKNKRFFKEYGKNVYVISGGFREMMLPVTDALGIPEENVFGNTFEYDKRGKITGVDKKNVLSQENGKIKKIKSLRLNGEVYGIGDGYTDYELKRDGVVKKFFAFTENVRREAVVKNADHVIHTFDEFLYINNLPMSISYPKSRMKILLLENIHIDAVGHFKEEGYTIETLNKSIDENELCEKIKDVSILGIRSKTKVTKKVLDSARRLLVIGAFCIGVDQIDLSETSKRGIAVFNAPYSNTRSVVELVIGEIIMLLRNVFDKSVKMHRGEWDKSSKNSFEMRGKKLGIIGYGNIGTQLSVAAESLGMDVFFYDLVEKLAIGNAVKCSSMEEVFRKCDIITLHVDGRPTNKNLVGDRELGLMKDGTILLNLSRGSIVDLGALAKYVDTGHIKGVAIDVYPHEPKSNDEKFVSELQNKPNIILTPHIGGSTEEAQKNIGQFVSSQITDFVNSGNTYLSVNLPNIKLPGLKDAHRLIHIHFNMPGVLASINGVLAKNKVNILGQYLKTDEHIGYVITDVGKKYDNKIMHELEKVPHTIKFRVLY